MRITRSRRFTVNMGDYESYTFGGEVSCDHHDLGYTDDNIAKMAETAYAGMSADLLTLVMETLDQVIISDVKEAGTLTPNKRSYILRAMGAEQPKSRRKG